MGQCQVLPWLGLAEKLRHAHLFPGAEGHVPGLVIPILSHQA